jgi:transcriptional regulator with XRE-family HTH domain
MLKGLPTLEKKAIAERVRLERDRCGLTQKALADKLGCSQQTVGNIEVGASYHPSILRSVAVTLGVTEDWLRTGRGAKGAGRAGESRGSVIRETQASYAAPPANVNYEELCRKLLPTAPEPWLKEQINELISTHHIDGARLLLDELARRKKRKP